MFVERTLLEQTGHSRQMDIFYSKPRREQQMVLLIQRLASCSFCCSTCINRLITTVQESALCLTSAKFWSFCLIKKCDDTILSFQWWTWPSSTPGWSCFSEVVHVRGWLSTFKGWPEWVTPLCGSLTDNLHRQPASNQKERFLVNGVTDVIWAKSQGVSWRNLNASGHSLVTFS